MRAFNRFTAMTLSIAMIIASMFTVGVFADAVSFTDVPADYQYSAAINSLVSKGIINGYTEEDGTSTFRPDNTITRAEFAKLLVLSTTSGVLHTATTDRFPDLALDHWANTYIAAAVNTGAINGYEDGSFRPENPVSYGEAVKMLVCTLGYGSIVTPTEPWYDGYIKIANSTGLTKSAVSLGSNEAKRGLVAQLIYNIADAKKLVQTGTDASGKPIYSTSDEDEDIEEVRGVVTAVFDTTLEGISYGLNKQQFMIGSEKYYLGDFSVERVMSFLGKSVIAEYENGSKKVLKNIEESKNETITVDDVDIKSVEDGVITYFADRKEKEVELADSLYVIYNGKGVSRDDIDDEFIEAYLNVSSGKLKLINNDGNKDIDVAIVTSYETMFVTSKRGSDGEYTIYGEDPASTTNMSITLDDDNCTIYKYSGSSKNEVNSLSSIAKNNVISVAQPIGGGEGTEVIISTEKLTGKTILSVERDGSVEIGEGKFYELTDYYQSFIDNERAAAFEEDDMGTFYLDFMGRIAYYDKSDSTTPYGYLMGIADANSGSSFKNTLKALILTAGNKKMEYFISSDLKIDGVEVSDVEATLAESAAIINEGKTIENERDPEVAQIIKYELNSDSEITDIYTIADGNINIYGDYATSETSLTYGTGRTFKDDGTTAFQLASDAVVFCVPEKRDDLDSYKKNSYKEFDEDVAYKVEGYDVPSASSRTVQAAVVYYSEGDSNASNIDGSTKAYFIESVSSSGSGSDKVYNVVCYEAGSKTTKTLYTDPDKITSFNYTGGDVLRFALNGTTIEEVQPVYVDGELYDLDGEVKTDAQLIQQRHSSDEDYYQVAFGKVASIGKTKDGKTDSVIVIPDGYDGDITYSLSGTQIYEWNADDDIFDTTIEDIDSVTVTTAEDAENATTVVVIKRGSNLSAIYIIE